MSTNPQNILIPQGTKVWVGEANTVGLTLPDDPLEAPHASIKDVGLTTEDSLKFSIEPNFEEVRAAQSRYAVRKFQTTETGEVGVDLLEWKRDNVLTAFGGGDITSPATGIYKFTPPALGERTEKVVLIDVSDGGKHYRFVFPRTLQTSGVDTELQAAGAATLPLALEILGGDNTAPWYLVTDDPAFAP